MRLHARGRRRLAGTLAAMHMASLLLVARPQPVLAAHGWAIGTDVASVTRHVTSPVVVTIQNTSTNDGGGDSIGCVGITVPGAYRVTGVTIDSVDGGYSWTASTSGTGPTLVRLQAIDDHNRLRGDPQYTVLQATITVEGLTEGVADWSAIEYEKWDCEQEQLSALLPMQVAPGANTSPSATDDAYAVVAGSVLTIAAPGVTANDSDPDGDPLGAVLESGPTKGSLALAADGGFTYAPDAGYVGPDAFTYRATDGSDVSASPATVVLDVTNDAPIGLPDAYGTPHDVLLVVGAASGVLANDADPDGHAISAQLVSGPSHGSLWFSPDGSFSYLSHWFYVGSDTFTYRVSDGYTVSAPVTVTLGATNEAPVAAPDAAATLHDTTLVVPPGSGVLANDTDGDGDPLVATLVSDVAHGTLALASDGSWTYTPDAGYVGPDGFTYAASDGIAASAAAAVSIDVTDAAPTAADDAYTVVHDTPLVKGAAAGVLANDADADGDPLAAQLVTAPVHGTLTLDVDGGFSYVPDPWFAGTDTFTYRATAGPGASSTATVTIAVTNAAPAQLPDAYAVHFSGALTVDAASGVLANDGDADGDTIHAMLVSGPSHGTLSLDTDGSFTYVPAGDWVGTDTFAYATTDGIGTTGGGTTVSIDLTDAAPVAADDAWSVIHGRTLVLGGGSGVLANDTDPDGDPLAAVLVSGPAHGTLALGSDGSVAYTPDPLYRGTDTFSYRASDGAVHSAAASVTITVTNADPVTSADAYSVAHGRVLVVPAAGVLANDTDPDGDVLTAAMVSGPAHGTLALAGDGSFTYVPDAGHVGADSFLYTAGDGLVAVTGIVTITIRNAAPVADASGWTTPFATDLSIDAPGVLAGASDADGDPLTAVLESGPAHGSLALAPDGSFTYRPDPGAAGTDTFTFRASDGITSSGIATVTISIGRPPATPAPTAAPTPEPTAEPTAEPSPEPSAEPSPAATSSPTPAPSAAPGGGAPGGSDTFSIPATTEDAGGRGGAAMFQGAVMALALDGFDWQIPGLLLSVPGLLVVLAIALQVTGGAAWLPIVRRTLGSRGDRRRRRAGTR